MSIIYPTVATYELYGDQASLVQPHEALVRYTIGGLHPVAIYDTFKDGRYIIHRKLGFGGSSTVWLAVDAGYQGMWLRGCFPDPTWDNMVCIKIKEASSSYWGLEGDHEIAKLGQLEDHWLNGPQDEPRTFARLLDCFVHIGPNGRHNCLVMELVGPCIASAIRMYRETDQVFRPDTLLRTTKQLFKAIEFAHEAGIAHGGISTTNVVFTSTVLHGDNDGDPLHALASSNVITAREPILSPHIPKHLIQCAVWYLWEDTPAEDILLVDWGQAFPVDAIIPWRFMLQPLNLQVPETLFVQACDYQHDLWRCGATIYHLIHGKQIIPSSIREYYTILCRIIGKLGALPEKWLPQLELIREHCRSVGENGIRYELIWVTFDAHQQAYKTAYIRGRDDDLHQDDEFTEYDFESLQRILWPMLSLLQYDPPMRTTLQVADAMINWVDHRRILLDACPEGDQTID